MWQPPVSMSKTVWRSIQFSKSRFRFRKHVADAANGADQRGTEPPVDFVAQGIDMDIHDVADAVEVNVPDMLSNHCSGDGPVRMRHQEFEKCVFLQLKIDD